MSQGGVEYLDVEDLLSFVDALGLGPARDVGLLESACARPRTTAFGIDAYASLEAKATTLLDSLARFHALAEGNERLAWLATVVFLDLNGKDVVLSDDEAFALVMDVAAGAVELTEIVERLATSAKASR